MTAPDLSAANLIEIIDSPLDPDRYSGAVRSAAAGAVVVFLGTVRDHSADRPGVDRLEYEAYAGVVEAKIAEIVAEARSRWPLEKTATGHRIGALDVGEISVVVAVSAGHRVEAFAAAEFLIDEIKARAPIWKKEHWEGGAEWVQGA